MKMLKSVSKVCAGVIAAGLLTIGGAGAASAQTVTAQFKIQNSFGSTITLDTASCTSGSIFPPFSISSGGNATFSGTTTSSSTLCTVRYQSGIYGCQFQVQATNTSTGFAATNAYKGSGTRPTCTKTGDHSIPGVVGWEGDFTMQ